MANILVLLFTLVFAAAVVGLLLGLHVWLAPKKPTPIKGEPFECGKDPLSAPGGRASVKFYIAAMLFLIFDVELVFLYPWAVLFKGLGPGGFAAMLFFLAVLMTGFVYAWKKGALKWS